MESKADFSGTWKMKSSKNFEELLKALGVNVFLRKIAVAAASRPAVEISQQGETLSIQTSTSVRTTHISFTVGESFNETTVDGRPCTSIPHWETESKIVCEQTLQKGDGPKTGWTRELTNDGELILDPSVTQHSSNTGYATLDLYNPFDNKTVQPPPPYEATVPSAPPPATTPPSRTTPTEPRNYGSYNTQNEDSSASGSYVPPILQSTDSQPAGDPQTAVNATTAELLKKQEELERRARELERRERELDAHALGAGASRQNNWPPLPSFCPVGPCFYQDISVEISQNFQRTVTIMYYYWMFTACTLLFNLISSVANFCVDVSSGGVGLGLAILWFILFTPCSFVCWYRPVYKAFRSDSSFNFFAFFFVFFAQVVFYVIMTIGIPGWGFSGWIVSLGTLRSNTAVGVIMLLNAVLFTAQTAMGVVMLKKVHSLYRQTGASFEKAQAEFATGVLSNQAVRQAAASATTSAAQGAFTGAR